MTPQELRQYLYDQYNVNDAYVTDFIDGVVVIKRQLEEYRQAEKRSKNQTACDVVAIIDKEVDAGTEPKHILTYLRDVLQILQR